MNRFLSCLAACALACVYCQSCRTRPALQSSFLSSPSQEPCSSGGFRGPERDGHFPAAGLLKEWPDGGPEQLGIDHSIGTGWPPPHPSFAAADGMLYLLENGPKCSLARPQADGFTVVSSFRPALGAKHLYTHPVIFDGKLYLRHGSTLVCYAIAAK